MYCRYHEMSGQPLDLAQPTTNLFGIGAGLFSAAATSVSPTLSDLVDTGSQAVRFAFRFGVHIYQTSESLEATDKVNAPWSFVIPRISRKVVQKEIDRYNVEMV
jgi:hypothetical protein